MILKKTQVIKISFFVILVEAFGFGYWPRTAIPSALSNALDKGLTLLCLGLMAIVVLLTFQRSLPIVFKKSLVLINLTLLLAFLASLFADDIQYSLTIAIRLTLFYLFILGVLSFRHKLIFDGLYFFIYFFVMANLLTILLFPSLGIESGVRTGTWRGLLVFKTQLGLASALLLTFLVSYCHYKFGRLSGKHIVLSLALLILLLGSRSYTAILLTLTYFLVSFGANHFARFSPNLKRLTLVSSLVFIPSLVLLAQVVSGDLVAGIGKEDSLNTRLVMWSLILEGFFEAPLAGYGLGRYLYLPGVLEKIQTAIWFFDITTMHNSFLEWILGAGGIAGTCYIVIHVKAVKTSFSSIVLKHHPMAAQVSTLMGPTLIGFLGAFITSSIAFSNLYWLAPITLAFFSNVNFNKVNTNAS